MDRSTTEPDPWGDPPHFARASRRAVVAVALLGGATIAVLLAGSVAHVTERFARPNAEVVVDDYLEALAAGDAAAARALDGTAVSDREQGVLDPDVLRGDAVLDAASECITDPQIGEVRQTADQARVDASYDLAGDEHSVTVELAWTGDSWRLTSGLFGRIAVMTEGESGPFAEPVAFAVGNTEVPAPRRATGAATEYLIYPGVYEITAAERTLSVVVSSGSSAGSTQVVDATPDEEQR